MAAPPEELQRPADGGGRGSECGRVRAAVAPREAPAAEAAGPETEAGEPQGPGEEGQPPRDPPLV